MSNSTKRKCGTCTKCCEGFIVGQAHGKPFYPGKPCHFISIGEGCSSYANRPEDPCKTYNCLWLEDPDLPEWMKPDKINAIIDMRIVKGIPYIHVLEAGAVLSSKVLSWVIQYALSNSMNVCWEVERGKNLLGTQEFLQAMQNRVDVPEPNYLPLTTR